MGPRPWDSILISTPTSDAEVEVQRIINLRLANNLLDAFTNYKGVTKSHISAANQHGGYRGEWQKLN